MSSRPSLSPSLDPELERKAQAYDDRRAKARNWGKAKGEHYRTYMKTSITGMEVGVAIGLGALLGLWADSYFESSPWGLAGGLVIGITHSIKLMVHITKKMKAEDEAQGEANATLGKGFDRGRPQDDLDRPFNDREDLRGGW